MENERKEQVIFLKDLVFAALYQWKKMLVVGLVLALLFGGFAVLSNRTSVSIGGLTMTPETQTVVNQLEWKLEKLDSLIADQITYMDESPLMTMDPYQVCSSGFQIAVQPKYASGQQPTVNATVETSIFAILGAYKSALSSSNLDAIAQKLDLSQNHIKDMIVFDMSNKVLSCQVRCSTMEQATEIAEVLLGIAQNATSDICQEVQDHTVSFLPTQTGPCYNKTIDELQTSAYKALSTYTNDKFSAETELKKYQPTELVASQANPLVYAILGGILGVCLVAGIALLGHLGSGRVYSARVLENRTGIRILGCVKSDKKHCFIDKWLRKLEGRSDNRSLASVAINIRNRCADHKHLLIMGCFCQEALEPVTDILQKAGIRCTLCADPQSQADALEALPQCDCVVLAESCGVSRYDSVVWAMQTVSDQEKPLLGCVLIDG